MGPSGSGKSTIMNIIGCLDRPTSGSYRLAGEDVSSCTEKELAAVRNKSIGFVFQQFQSAAAIECKKNVELPMIYAGIGKKSVRNGLSTRWKKSVWRIGCVTCRMSCRAARSGVSRLQEPS